MQGLTFLFQVIKDNVNLRHTANLVLSLCRYNNKLAENVSTKCNSNNNETKLTLI